MMSTICPVNTLSLNETAPTESYTNGSPLFQKGFIGTGTASGA
jgi:hypothetical protein